MSVLVGYASEYGSTREIAERIAHTLEGHGLAAEVRSLDQVQNAVGYDAVVAGSAVHNMAWLGQAKQFVTHNRDVLADRPVWFFSVGMPAALRRPLRKFAETREASKVIADFPAAIGPRDHRLFSGVYDRTQNASLFGRLLFKVVAGRYGDFRDWQKIDAWANSIARALVAESRDSSQHSP